MFEKDSVFFINRAIFIDEDQILSQRTCFMDYELDNAFSGMQFDGFRLTGKIGEGELGVVYSAVNSLGTVAACKILKPEIAQAGSAVQQFVYEAKTASKLSHPNVVKAITAGHSLGYYYFLMEYVDGVSLEKLRRENPEIMTFDFVCDRFAELADALGYAWKNHLVTHGDIKPENILIQRDPAVLKLADLGLARVALNTASSRDVIMGTPLYIAPELVSGDISKPTVKSDVYSFGVMFYELICGTPPFSGSVEEVLRAHIEDEPVPVREYNPSVSEELEGFIHSLISKNPDARPDWGYISNYLRNRGSSPKKSSGKKASTPAVRLVQKLIIILLSLFIFAEIIYVFFFI